MSLAGISLTLTQPTWSNSWLLAWETPVKPSVLCRCCLSAVPSGPSLWVWRELVVDYKM